jgi:TolA-binding protein
MGPETQKLVAGIKTGGMIAPHFSPPTSESRTAIIEAPSSSAPRPPLPIVSTAPPPVNMPAKNPWVGRGITLGVLCALAGGAWLVNRQITQAMEQAAKAQAEAAEQIERQRAAMEAKLAEERSRAELEIKAAEAQRESSQLLEEGVKDVTEGRFPHAVATLDQLIEKHPKRDPAVQALFFRGKALLALDRKTDAIKDLSAFLDQRAASPDAPEAMLRRAQAYARNLQFDEAQADFTSFFQRNPGGELKSEALLARADLYLVREKYAEARADAETVIATGSKPEAVEAAKALLAKLPPPEKKK